MSQQEQNRRCPGCGAAQKRHGDCWLDLSCSNHAAACPWYKAFCSVGGRDAWHPHSGDLVMPMPADPDITAPLKVASIGVSPYYIRTEHSKRRWHKHELRPAWPDEIEAPAPVTAEDRKGLALRPADPVTAEDLEGADQPLTLAVKISNTLTWLQHLQKKLSALQALQHEENVERRRAALATLENQHHVKKD